MYKQFTGNLFPYFETGVEGLIWSLKIDDYILTLQEGDFLKVFDHQGKLIYDTVILKDQTTNLTGRPNTDLRQQTIGNYWVHWLQKNHKSEKWLLYFTNELNAEVDRYQAQPDQIIRYQKALSFASVKHASQKRKADGTPYINHLIEVASILSSEGGIVDLDILSAAILHDVLEDTNTTKKQLQHEFGSHITNIVVELSDDKNLERKERKAMALQKILNASAEARLIKIADIISNLIHLPGDWSFEKTQEYINYCKLMAAPCFQINEHLASKFKKIIIHAE